MSSQIQNGNNGKNAETYIAKRFVLQETFKRTQNPRLINKSGFKSRAGYNSTRTVFKVENLLAKIT